MKNPDPAKPDVVTETGVGSRGRSTPMMEQYFSIRETTGDALLFYRMGDFYELFFDDAVTAARALDITLTTRGQHNGEGIPMCGVPFHAYETYLAKLIKAGFKVAICEQLEDPAAAKKRGSKAVVKRGVVRTITPGTILEESLLDSRSHNFLAAIAVLRRGDEAALAWTDVSTGEFFVRPTELGKLETDLSVIGPRELIIADNIVDSEWAQIAERAIGANAITNPPSHQFDSTSGQSRLMDVFGVASLDGFGSFLRAETAALGGLLTYLEATQSGRMPALRPPQRSLASKSMTIDAATRASLEISHTQSGQRKGSLLWATDRTLTGPGARLLASRLAGPLTDPAKINDRFDAVAFFTDAADLRDSVREILKGSADIARAVARLALDSGGPRDLAAIRRGLVSARELATAIDQKRGLAGRPPIIENALEKLEDRAGEGFSSLIKTLRDAVDDAPPLLARDGGFIAKGFDPGLDQVRQLRDESRRVIANLEARYRTETGVKPLKVRHNNVLGYFVETPPTHGDKLLSPPHNDIFIHRQTLASAVRFTTTELADLDAKISRARDKALARELELFADLVVQIRNFHDQLSNVAVAMAEIDVCAALAELSVEESYSRPVVDDGRAFEIKNGRHPVVERALRSGAGEGFIPNDCQLSQGPETQLWLITGPNMAGKSTFLRQNALIAILAQAGSFVPATSAHIGVVDRVFSRVGAADDLAKGRSTFMVEMVETAAILNQATDRSLVVLDEVGRGTSTFDGLSIAWAALEHLHDVIQCRGLFATHYHELTSLAERLSRLANYSMQVREWKGDVIFLHEVKHGAADRSYGVAVAKLAGLPSEVVQRAEAVLSLLEKQRKTGTTIEELPLFAAAPPEQTKEEALTLEAAMADVNPDNLSPKEALDTLYRLKSGLGDGDQ